MVFVSDYKNRRTSDDEKGIEFNYKYGDRDGFENYELLWNGQRITIGVTKIVLNTEGKKPNITWNIQKIEIPEGFSNRKQEVLDTIVDAFKSYGLFHDRDRVAHVDINFSPKIQELQR